jgi:hypothetical protein
MIRLIAWVLSIIYLIVLGIPIAIGLLIILQIISILKFISNATRIKKCDNSPLPTGHDHFFDDAECSFH